MDEVERRRGLLTQLTCTPSRRSTKFSAGPNARQFFFFDSTVSRMERLLLLSSIFVFQRELVDQCRGRGVLASTYKLASYIPEELVEVRVVCDVRHPAFGQAGLYAKKAIPGNTIICPYAGFVEIFASSCNSRTYTMGFGSSSDDYALDAEFAGNHGRFANDPRGIEGLTANVSAENRMNARGEFFTAMVSRGLIGEGEELLMAYGKAHSLGASPWTDVRGNPLMRVRRGGELPFPNLASETSTNPTTTSASAPAFELYWECPQCGGWNQGEPTPQHVARCATCRAPKLYGCPQVAALSHPPVTRADLLAAVRGADGAAAALDTPAALSPHTSAGSWPWPGPHSASPSSSPPPPPAASTSIGGSEGSSASWSPSSPAPSALSPVPSPGSPASKSSGGHHHSVTYASIHVDWPLNVVFMPWQVWDPSVPLTTVMKLSRFETHGHILVFHVTYNADQPGVDVEEKEDHNKAGEEEGDPHEATGESVTAACKAHNGHSHTSGVQTRAARMHAAEAAPAARKGRVQQRTTITITKKNTARTEAAGARKRGRTEPSTSAASASASSTPEPPVVVAAAKTSRARRVSDADRMAKTVTKEDEHDRLNQPSRRARTGTHLNTSELTALHDSRALNVASSATDTSDEASASVHLARAAALLPVVAPAGTAAAALGRLLHRAREVERLVCLPAWSMVQRQTSSSSSPPTPATAMELSSPLRHAREALCAMSQRVLSARSFEAGELVAYLGGAVRPLSDVRCRPDWSPLCLPLRYLLPTAWRRAVLEQATTGAAREDTESNKEAMTAAVAPLADAPTRAAFLARLASLMLLVTNEMMYCPCIIAPLDDEEETDHPHLLSGLRSGGATSDATPRDLYEAERQAVLETCNVALVLNMDALGSPFIAAVAIRRIEAFEPLLARTQ